MKPTMWLLLSGILVGTAALPVDAAPLGVHGVKAADADSPTTPVGGYYRHHGYPNWYYPRYSRRSYRYYDEPSYYYRYAQPYYPYYYRPYRRHYGPSLGFYYGGHRGWRGHW